MSNAVKKHQEKDDLEEDDIEISLDSLKAQRDRLDSQLNRFLNFLDDQALARVRLLITLRIMEAISQYSPTKNQILAEYVHRVKTLFYAAKEDVFEVDLKTHFGTGGEFKLSEYLQTATFYFCLPVWPECEAQLFEEKVNDEEKTGFGVMREVSYHFRINGENPIVGKPAFEARLDKIYEELRLDDENSSIDPKVIPRLLAQLIFLAIVVPNENGEHLSLEELSQSLQEIIQKIKTGGKEAVREIITDLQKNRAKVMEKIASDLITVISTKSEKIISQVQREISQQFICVKHSIMEWSRLTAGASENLLVGSENPGRETVEWFKHIEVCDTPETPGLLFSVQVSTEISEHNLVTKGNPYSIKAQRILPKHLLQIIWVPFSFSKQDR